MRDLIIKRLRELIAITNARATEYVPPAHSESDGLDDLDDGALHVMYENTLAHELTFGTAPLGGRPVSFSASPKRD
jgi:hypothetical protein